MRPRLLIPSPYPGVDHGPRGIIQRFVIDYTSIDALGKGDETHSLEQFNVAVLTCIQGATETQIDIWRVNVVRDAQDSVTTQSLMLSERLSSYTDTPTKDLTSAALHGTAVAYSVSYCRHQHVAHVGIVDWSQSNGKTREDIIHYSIPMKKLTQVKLVRSLTLVRSDPHRFLSRYNSSLAAGC